MRDARFWILYAAALAAASSPGPESITAGSLGSMAGRRGGIETRQRLAAGLRDGRAEVRAAAARVAHVNGESSLQDALWTALDAESDRQTAREMVRALAALAPAAQDRRLLEASARLTLAGDAVEAIGLSRGPAAITEHLLSLRASRVEPEHAVSFLLAASRRRVAHLGAAAETALRSAEPEAWEAVTEACRHASVVLERETLKAALGHRLAPIRRATSWYLVDVLGRRPAPSPPELLAALEGGAALDGDAASGVDGDFVQEVVARMLGRPARDNPAYAAALSGAVAERVASSASRWLTGSEREAMRGKLGRRAEALEPSLKKPPDPPVPLRTRLLGGLPRGLAAAVMAETGCDVGRGRWMVVAEVEYDERSRPRRVDLLDGAAVGNCRQAAAALLALGLPEARHPPDPPRPDTVLLFLERGDPAALDARDTHDPGYALDAESPEVVPPERKKHVQPRYPPPMRNRGHDGRAVLEIVVGADGEPRDFRLLGADDPEFAIEALSAVARWRFLPATREGRPVSVFLKVVVEFRLI